MRRHMVCDSAAEGVNSGPTDTTAGKGDEGRVVDQVLRGGRQPHSEECSAGEGGERKDTVCIKTCVVAACHVVKDVPRSQSLSLSHPLSPCHSSCISSSSPPPRPLALPHTISNAWFTQLEMTATMVVAHCRVTRPGVIRQHPVQQHWWCWWGKRGTDRRTVHSERA